MLDNGKQPERSEHDGAVRVERNLKDEIIISVTHKGAEQTLVMGEFNAWRIFGMLAFLLGAKLSKALQSAIRL
jgi:hypothetical protein